MIPERRDRWERPHNHPSTGGSFQPRKGNLESIFSPELRKQFRIQAERDCKNSQGRVPGKRALHKESTQETCRGFLLHLQLSTSQGTCMRMPSTPRKRTTGEKQAKWSLWLTQSHEWFGFLSARVGEKPPNTLVIEQSPPIILPKQLGQVNPRLRYIGLTEQSLKGSLEKK